MRHSDIITTAFTLHADLTRNPSHSRMEKQQQLHQSLEEVYDVIVPSYMRQLVHQKHFQLTRRQSQYHR